MLLVRRDCRSSAFTLIELLAVMAIIAVLTTFAFGIIKGVREHAAVQRAKAELAILAGALEEYRRYYGDYPQTGEFAHAAPDTGSRLNVTHAEAKLFNALTGVFGPSAFGAANRLNGSSFVDILKLRLDPTITLPANFQNPFGTPPLKPEVTACFVDPWGRRYLYYYRSARNPAQWQAPGYGLYSTGHDGQHTGPPVTGIFAANQQITAANADNIYAHP